LTDTPMPDFEQVLSEHEEMQDQLTSDYEMISQIKTHPCISITTQDGRQILSKDEYVACVIDVFNCPEEYRLSKAAGVKVRGNSTAEMEDEKPYRIKFDKKQNMLGLHNGEKYKSWVLLRSFWNLCPDYMAFSLAKPIFGDKYYSSDACYVNLYINGQDAGVYLLCEQNQVAEGRVDVNEAKKTETGTNIGYLVERDNYANSAEHPFFSIDYKGLPVTDIAGTTRVFKVHNYSIKSDINTQEQVDFIRQYIINAFDILYEAAVNGRAIPGLTPKESVETVMDLESLANMLIIEELTHDYDVGGGSFYIAADFSEGSSCPRLTFTAPWDFNFAYGGEPDAGFFACTFQDLVLNSDRSNPWFIVAMKADWFQEIVKQRWRELSESGALVEKAEAVREEIKTLENDLGDKQAKLRAGLRLVDFVRARINWLDSVWK
ncbi:MAG: CotH kinase family protein, partial [Parasporobacterium sp.]|nr:CotH kinase family protein [Parasporobacterium sp.]